MVVIGARGMIKPPNVGGLYGINVETLTANKTLTVGTDEIYQYLDPGTGIRTITLSTVGASAGDRFILKNTIDPSNTRYLIILSGVTTIDYIYMGTVKSFIFSGTSWVGVETGSGRYNIDGDSIVDLAIGYQAEVRGSSVAIGYSPKAILQSVAIGYNSGAGSHGVAVGYTAYAADVGVSVGEAARGDSYGVGVGYAAEGKSFSIGIGYRAKTNSKRYSIALGPRTQCTRTAETAINIKGYDDSGYKNQVVQGRWAGATADGVAAEVFLGARANERFTIRAKSALAFKGTVVASTEATAGVPNVTSAWKVEGLIKRDADGNTTMVGVAHAVIAQDGGAAAWDAVFSADDVNEALILTVTGAAATTIQWAARIDGVETVW